MSKPKRDSLGRRKFKFTPCHKHFTYFIEKQDVFFSTIGISTNGLAIERFDYSINYENKTSQQVFDENIIQRIKNNDNYQYCAGIFLICQNTNEIETDNTVTQITKENLIVSSLCDKNKLMIFDINGKIVLSLYGHIHNTNVDKETLEKLLPFNEVLNLQGDLYYECFEALRQIAKNNITTII